MFIFVAGVAFIFNQKFFNDLNQALGIELENIVYYKGTGNLTILKGIVSRDFKVSFLVPLDRSDIATPDEKGSVFLK
jgi:hypothetical protein